MIFIFLFINVFCESIKLVQNLLYIYICTAAAAKSVQSCPTLCNPVDGSPPGSPIPGILQARTLEWVAISKVSIQPEKPVKPECVIFPRD